ncbi:MAG: ABC transporter substrate-binding protein, partial [Oscillospiraceae bacterium]|nr:ABC transporter substrate-binding protein [Oscillospiraceae bacterium]
MKKKFLALLLALAMTLALAACGGGEAAGAIKIGSIGPLTGSTAQYGIATEEGAKIAIEEINALGGLQFELNGQDDEADGEKGV